MSTRTPTLPRFALFALSLLAWSCASTALDVSPESAANPEAHTMPTANKASPLREDYDPWQGSAEHASAAHAGHDMHEGHAGHDMHEGHAGDTHQQEGHGSEKPAGPSKSSKEPKPAAPNHGGHDHE